MNLPPLVTKALAEFLGVTLFLTAICGAVVYQQGPLGTAALAAVLGLAILVTAPISGGHLNPIVSIYFFSRREIGLVQLLVYLVAQITGAIFGAFIASQMFLQSLLPDTSMSTANSGALISELFVAGGLVWLVGRLATTSKAHMIPAAVGLWVFAAAVFSSSGAQANPAVTIALILVGQSTATAAGYILAQLGGMLIAAIFILVFAERKRVMVENLEVEKPADLAKVAARKPAAKKTATK
jgi:glycerol uptake facilitator-like aquaporin